MHYDLLDDVAGDDQDGVGQVKQQPQLHWLDVRGGGETGGHREVDRGQNHHAGDVDGEDQTVLVLSHYVISRSGKLSVWSCEF